MCIAQIIMVTVNAKLLIVVAVVVLVSAVVACVVLTRPYGQAIDGFAPVIITQASDNEIRLVNNGGTAVGVGEGQYSVSTTPGVYSWTDLPGLNPGEYFSLGTYAPGTYYVSFRYQNENAFSDVPVTVTAFVRGTGTVV